MNRRPVRLRVVPSEHGLALAAFVAKRIPNVDGRNATALVKAGAVYMGHLRVRVPSTKVAAGERISVYCQALSHAELDPADTVRIVHRDPAFIVLDKPAGIPVAATRASARGTLSEALRRFLHAEGVQRPYVGLVHRLDRGASGLVLFTVRGIANKSLHKRFAEHRIQRTYRVRVHGDAPASFACDAPIIEHPGSNGMKVARNGERRAKSARTRFVRLRAGCDIPGTSLLEAQLETGRTHQIRVHAAECGFPVVGDRRYGREGGPRLLLHAYQLAFEHPLSPASIELSSDLDDWAQSQ